MGALSPDGGVLSASEAGGADRAVGADAGGAGAGPCSPEAAAGHPRALAQALPHLPRR